MKDLLEYGGREGPFQNVTEASISKIVISNLRHPFPKSSFLNFIFPKLFMTILEMDASVTLHQV